MQLNDFFQTLLLSFALLYALFERVGRSDKNVDRPQEHFHVDFSDKARTRTNSRHGSWKLQFVLEIVGPNSNSSELLIAVTGWTNRLLQTWLLPNFRQRDLENPSAPLDLLFAAPILAAGWQMCSSCQSKPWSQQPD